MRLVFANVLQNVKSFVRHGVSVHLKSMAIKSVCKSVREIGFISELPPSKGWIFDKPVKEANQSNQVRANEMAHHSGLTTSPKLSWPFNCG